MVSIARHQAAIASYETRWADDPEAAQRIDWHTEQIEIHRAANRRATERALARRRTKRPTVRQEKQTVRLREQIDRKEQTCDYYRSKRAANPPYYDRMLRDALIALGVLRLKLDRLTSEQAS